MHPVRQRPEHHPATAGRGPWKPPTTVKGLIATVALVPVIMAALAYPAAALTVLVVAVPATAATLALRTLAAGRLGRSPTAMPPGRKRSGDESSDSREQSACRRDERAARDESAHHT